jgi:hypothetical protein
MATALLMLLLADRLPRVIGGGLALAFWAALVPASFAVEIGAESGSLSTVQQPTLAFVAVAGLGVTLLFIFAAVTGRLSPRREGVGA